MVSIFKRINDVITANINDLVDRVEDPERMVKQIIREMEDNIRISKEGVIEAIASEKRLERELELNRKQCEEWGQKAEQAVRNGSEELARAALVRKREHADVCKALEPSWQAAAKTSERLKTQLRALEAKLEEARRNAARWWPGSAPPRPASTWTAPSRPSTLASPHRRAFPAWRTRSRRWRPAPRPWMS